MANTRITQRLDKELIYEKNIFTLIAFGISIINCISGMELLLNSVCSFEERLFRGIFFIIMLPLLSAQYFQNKN